MGAGCGVVGANAGAEVAAHVQDVFRGHYRALSAAMRREEGKADALALQRLLVFNGHTSGGGDDWISPWNLPDVFSPPHTADAYVRSLGLLCIEHSERWDVAIDRPVSPAFLEALMLTLEACPYLMSLFLTEQVLADALAGRLERLLGGWRGLESLTLSRCHLAGSHADGLARGLAALGRLGHSPLKYVDISDNHIGDDHLVLVVEALKYHVDLRVLILAGTGCGDEAVTTLCGFIGGLRRLLVLDLSSNPGITSESARQLRSALSFSSNPRRINLAGTSTSARSLALLMRITERNESAYRAFDDLLVTATSGPRVRSHDILDPMISYCNTEVDETAHTQSSTSEARCTDRTCLEVRERLVSNPLFSSLESSLIKALVNSLSSGLPEGVSGDAHLVHASIASVETLGQRSQMEDTSLLIEDFHTYRQGRPEFRGPLTANKEREILLAIFDGHGGTECSTQVGRLFPSVLADMLNHLLFAAKLESPLQVPDVTWPSFFTAVFLTVDEMLRERHVKAGSTAIVCYVTQDFIVAANCGDSRAILLSVAPHQYSQAYLQPGTSSYSSLFDVSTWFSDEGLTSSDDSLRRKRRSTGTLTRLSRDHKPTAPEEARRVEAAGGYVRDGRVMSGLSVCRAFGDFEYKPIITVVPYVCVTRYHAPGGAWLILACDGCWDVMSDEDVAFIARSSPSAQAGALRIRDGSYWRESQDNISVITAVLTCTV
ncbi:Protein phosphatase 2C-like protein [Giardia muris]|uniref:Protein phosphatase 2C-like protein n=1 Tax=Giardia muris TaxID=5742 RepID=A0A4Z1T2A7_GIAMU|nr:Protein phosphatase 2C-like protein [Giardia muris]|eukprot:TNJ26719.1 Protein phosphatase 2C-like protein [Giardia muris]